MGKPLDVFTVRDLRQKSGKLIKDAAAGRVTLITKHGKPAIVALPFDKRLLDQGVHKAMALHLFEARTVTLTQAAKLAGVSVEEFIDLLGKVGIDAVDYSPDELQEEVDAA